MMEDLEIKIEQLAQLIIESKNIVALTGAGMSTESGIPDFRSPDTGLWNKYDPEEMVSIHSYVSDTSKNLDFMFEMGKTILMAKPNKGHKALTKLPCSSTLSFCTSNNISQAPTSLQPKSPLMIKTSAGSIFSAIA